MHTLDRCGKNPPLDSNDLLTGDHLVPGCDFMEPNHFLDKFILHRAASLLPRSPGWLRNIQTKLRPTISLMVDDSVY